MSHSCDSATCLWHGTIECLWHGAINSAVTSCSANGTAVKQTNDQTDQDKNFYHVDSYAVILVIVAVHKLQCA